jgi:hypothetical protein
MWKVLCCFSFFCCRGGGGGGEGGVAKKGCDLQHALLVSAELPFKKSARVGEGQVIVEVENSVAVGKHDVPADVRGLWFSFLG